MKHLRAGLCSFLILAVTGSLSSQAQKPVTGPSQATGSVPAAPAPVNPLKVALLHWYGINETAHFPVGSQPYGLCFDGANIWAANFGAATVNKIRAADSAVLGTFKVGNEPFGVTFDGANVWVSNSVDGTVTKLRASDGTTLGTFSAGGMPGGGWMAFDGQNVWVTNGGTNAVLKLRPAMGRSSGLSPLVTLRSARRSTAATSG